MDEAETPSAEPADADVARFQRQRQEQLERERLAQEQRREREQREAARREEELKRAEEQKKEQASAAAAAQAERERQRELERATLQTVSRVLRCVHSANPRYGTSNLFKNKQPHLHAQMEPEVDLTAQSRAMNNFDELLA
jgi:hypothetical protein